MLWEGYKFRIVIYSWVISSFTFITFSLVLLIPIFLNGKKVYETPSLNEIRDYCLKQVDRLWDEVKRFENPHNYYVDLSQKLWDVKHNLLEKNKKF